MKLRFLSVILLCVLLIGNLAACGGTVGDTTPMPATPTPTTLAPITPAPTSPTSTTPTAAVPAPTVPATTPATTTPVSTTPATTPTSNTPAATTPVATTPADTTPTEVTLPVVLGSYVSPENSPLSDEQKSEIEEAWFRKTGCVLRWFDAEQIATRHFGVRYYGSADSVIYLAVPQGEVTDAEHEVTLHAYYEGEFFSAASVSTPYQVWQSLEGYHNDFVAVVLQRDDLDDPGVYGGEHPALGSSPYTGDQLATLRVRPTGHGNSQDGYLGTYNGYSAYVVFDMQARGYRKVMIGGLYFWWEEYSVTVCNGTEVYALDEAFDLGLLAYEDLRAIAYYWYGETLPEKPLPILPSIEGNFADNKVLLVMTREASLNFHTYTPEDFPEIACAKVQDLSDGSAAKVKAQLQQAGIDPSSMEIDEWTTFDSPKIDAKYKDVVNNYRQILCLTLAEPGKENVIAAIALLRERDDVKSAGPDSAIQIEWD